jgi:uncharacterized protein HemX
MAEMTHPAPEQTAALGSAPAPESTAPRTRPAWLLVAAVAVPAALVAGGVGFAWGHHAAKASDAAAASASVAAAEAASDERLSEAYQACHFRDDTLELGDDGETIVIDTRSEYGSVDGMQCVLAELDTPESIEAAIGRTTSLMGLQSDDHDGLDYSWSYHPDNGVNMVITLQD